MAHEWKLSFRELLVFCLLKLSLSFSYTRLLLYSTSTSIAVTAQAKGKFWNSVYLQLCMLLQRIPDKFWYLKSLPRSTKAFRYFTPIKIPEEINRSSALVPNHCIWAAVLAVKLVMNSEASCHSIQMTNFKSTWFGNP